MQELQSKEPDQDLSFLLEANGYDDLANQLSGDNFWCYNIDWTPIHMYQFSLIRFSKYSYLKRRERELTFIHLENDEYATILSRRLMAQGYSFTSLQSEFPELAGKIMSQISSVDEYGGLLDEPYVLFMDEVEEDAQKILGSPLLSVDLCTYGPEELGGIFITSKDEVFSVVKEDNDECEVMNVQTGYMSSYFQTKEEMSDIPSKPFKEYFNETDIETILDKLEEMFSGSDGFEKIREFMDEQQIPYQYNSSKGLV